MSTKILGASLLCFCSLSLAAGRGVTAEDYYAFKNVTDARISPNGKFVAYTVTSAERNKRFSEIWLTATDGSRPESPFTTGPSSNSPRWSPDGKSVAFISTRPGSGSKPGHSDRPQVYLLSLSGGEARRLTDLEAGVESFQWSPQGDRLVCVSKTGPKRTAFDKGGSDVRHYTSITYKFNDTGYYDERRSHLFIVKADTGEATQITSGSEHNDLDPKWSPDGRSIVFNAEDTSKPVMENNDICVVPAGGGAIAKISNAPGYFHNPRWSPDGTRIAYSGAVSADELPKIHILPATGGKPVLASKELDLSPGELNWASERTIYFEAPSRGESQIFRVDPQTGKIAAVTSGSRSVRRMDFNKETGTMVYIVNDFKHLDDLYMAGGPAGGEKRLSDVNQSLLSQLDLQDVERITFKGSEGAPVDGFFVKPLGWSPAKKYPMVLSIHGGPSSMYGVDWFHEAQVYAAHGWAVFYANPHGSSGYGEEFQRSVAKNWGGKPYVDLMDGVDAILAKYPWIDRERLGVTGGSYVGFMTNWIVGHTTRFKAAVTLRSIANFTSVEGTRDAAYGHARDFGGDLFQNFDLYWNTSPLKYAGQVKTPTLILHSDNDYRVPIEQGEQWFRALKHFGVTTELVIFPRENHNLTRSGEPRHLVESLNWQIYWFDRFLNEDSGAVRPNEK
jgi:dipeptidyl aminopeptidase/acylaminoacyl peptidase